jgi:DNA polymerase III delta prime subunit
MEILEFNDKNTSSWLDRFKPMRINEIVGNYKAINQIILWVKNFDKNRNEFFEKQKLLSISKANKKKKSKKDKTTKDSENQETVETVEEVENEDNLDEAEEETNAIPIFKGTFNNDKSSCLLVTGNHGVGKTCSVYAILNELGFTIQVVNFSRIKTNSNIKDIIDRVSNKNSIINNMFNKKNEKMVIVIDELESLASQTEKACITALIKNNEQYWTQPIIFISNNQHNKLLGDIKKISYEIKFWQPYPEDISVLLKRICSKTHMKLENDNVMITIIDYSQKDLRRLIMILQDIKTIYGDTIITEDIIVEYFKTAKKKDTDFDLFKATKNLLFNYDGIEDSLRYYEIDKTAIPLMTQQNYINCINEFTKNSNDTEKDKLKLAGKLSNLISKADIIENFIHSEMSWDINIAHAYYSSIKPSYLLDKYLIKSRNTNIVYPLDLNKYSIKRINKINIDNVNKVFSNMDIEDYIYVNQIIREQINDNKFKDCIENFKDYKDFKVETLERLLKVDKIKCSKTNLKSKEKKEISNYLNNKVLPIKIEKKTKNKENIATKK